MDETNTHGMARALLKVAACLLLLVWIASMSLADDRLCSSVPLCLGFAVVAVLAVVAMVLGARPPSLSLTCLLGLAAGLYFFIRCVATDMPSEIWRELPLLFSSFVFYGAGYCFAQRRGGMVLTNALMLGVVANIVGMVLMHATSAPLEVIGRPAMSMAGANTRGAALFTYKNFAGVFLMTAGVILLCRPLWVGWKGKGSLVAVIVGLAGIACSFLTGSRAIIGLLPILAVGGWGLWVVIRMYGEQRASGGVVLSGAVLLVGVALALGDLFLGDSLLQKLLTVDTHERTAVWSALCNLLPNAPWYGHGAGATQWWLIPYMPGFATCNYAHNEYLQAWMDYGLVGAGLVVAVLLAHLASGFWSLASETVSRGRRALVAACMLLLIAMAVSSVLDFIWHSIALAGLTAFACGVLASPVPRRKESLFSRRKWAEGSGPSLRPVRFMGRGMTALACVACASLAAVCAWLGWQLLPGWQAQWEYNALCHRQASDAERVEFLERVMPVYPDPALADHYATLHQPADREGNLGRMETVFRLALRANPHQLYTEVMLADVLGQSGKFEEAESLLRDAYLPNGQHGAYAANWPRHYGMNLLGWGRQRLAEGDYASALSMMEYALNICVYGGGFSARRWDGGASQNWLNRRSTAFIAARQVDVDMLHAIGVQKDDSWKKPMRPGGPAALYARWGDKPYKAKPTNPYSRRSPLNPQKK